eukprot:TRINITY_DN49700_c0_g1_i1.p1 TRINITY_DN49700_c0_g1~~TRINITY_DN49700_c0_g1_i1.p1  ORF type:complete len:249 (-),score=28.61 TRINITY_DN49700_c0_g1_i1:154-804(-)
MARIILVPVLLAAFMLPAVSAIEAAAMQAQGEGGSDTADSDAECLLQVKGEVQVQPHKPQEKGKEGKAAAKEAKIEYEGLVQTGKKSDGKCKSGDEGSKAAEMQCSGRKTKEACESVSSIFECYWKTKEHHGHHGHHKKTLGHCKTDGNLWSTTCAEAKTKKACGRMSSFYECYWKTYCPGYCHAKTSGTAAVCTGKDKYSCEDGVHKGCKWKCSN